MSEPRTAAANGPADVAGTIATWERVSADDARALREAVGREDVTNTAVMTRLRRTWSRDEIAVAVELTAARRRAARKFPECADRIVADVTGVEQATDHVVAAHKAVRFATALADGAAERVLDLCCGIGGDAMALAGVGPVTGVDRDPLRAWMAARNAGCPTVTADVAALPDDLDPRGALLHVDPDRRRAGRSGDRRAWRYEDYAPGPDVLADLLARTPHAAVKLGPGVDLDDLPTGDDGEIEVIAHGTALVQAVLWRGALARSPGARTATRLPDGGSVTGVPTPLSAPHRGGFDRYLHMVAPEVERTGLEAAAVGALPVAPVVPGLGVLTSAEPVASPWLTPFEIVAEMPWRMQRLRAWLRANDAGVVTVRTRGGAVDADAAQRTLRGKGTTPYTVFGLRLERPVVAIVTRPVTPRG